MAYSTFRVLKARVTLLLYSLEFSELLSFMSALAQLSWICRSNE